MRRQTRCRVATLVSLISAAGLLQLAGCGPQPGVGQRGQYLLASDATIVDTAPYPLEHLLTIEHDDKEQSALIYLFSGDLRSAGLGLPDLRRIAAHFGGFEMAFEADRSGFSLPEDGAESVAATGSDGREFRLYRLDDMTLKPSGATRLLSSVTSSDYDVRAYATKISEDGDLPAFDVALDAPPLAVPPEPPSPTLSITARDEGGFTLQQVGADADYLMLDLLQAIHDKSTPDAPIDALMRTRLPADGAYAVGLSLLTSAAEQGCWSKDRPVTLRVTEVKRSYFASDAGDRAVIQQRATSLELDAQFWPGMASELHPVAYCDDYE